MISISDNKAKFLESLQTARTENAPYTHWILDDVFDDETLDDVLRLPFAVQPPQYGEGTRAVNNDSRRYFDTANIGRHASCRVVAETMQSQDTVDAIEEKCGIDLANSYLRIEYAQDSDGFCLEPHTDISVKLFTMLVYLSKEPEAASLGTDIYDGPDRHVGAVPFKSNRALIFVPGKNTWHGFVKRPIMGVRRSLIINYVTGEWRARNELAYPEAAIA